jgi:hypothetical protein
MMGLRNSAVLALLLATSASAFTQSSPAFATRSPTRISALLEDDAGLENALAREVRISLMWRGVVPVMFACFSYIDLLQLT